MELDLLPGVFVCGFIEAGLEKEGLCLLEDLVIGLVLVLTGKGVTGSSLPGPLSEFAPTSFGWSPRMGSELVPSNPICTEEVLCDNPRENPTSFLGVRRSFPIGDVLRNYGVERVLGLASTTPWLSTSAARGCSSTGKGTKSSGWRGTSGCIVICSIIRSAIFKFAIKIRLAIVAISSKAVGGVLPLSFGVETGSGSDCLAGSPFS